ncbi:MAG TPA: metal ABC transporter permease, partial [Nitrososphaera sp.]
AGIAVAITTSVIGLFLVLRRNSLFGDALSHVAFGGIAVGLVTSVYPLWTGMAFSVLGALGIIKLRQSTRIPADATVAILLAGGLALGLFLMSTSLSGNLQNIISYLFGSILLVSIDDTLAILAMAGGVLAIVILLYRQLVYVTFDEEQAKVSGLSITKLSYLFAVLASITVIVSMRLVGILLVSALIVIPTVTALLLGKGFKKTALISVAISISSVVTGIVVSFVANSPPSATIVMVLIGVFVATLVAKYSSKRRMEEKLEAAKS